MRKIFLLSVIFFFVFSITAVYSDIYNRQKRGSIRKAINERSDLLSENKHSIRKRFGYPVFRKKHTTSEGVTEEWIYKLYSVGTMKINITFLNEQVTEVIYSGKEEDVKKK